MRATQEILQAAAGAKRALALCDTAQKNKALFAAAASLRASAGEILAQNGQDLAGARGKIPEPMLDRLALNKERLEDMARGLEAVAALPDPVGRCLEERSLPNGLILQKVAVPMGVVAIIYESRPNVTADAAALAVKSGNACVLRGGREAFRSNLAITQALRTGFAACGLPGDAVSLVEDTSRASAAELMTASGLVDLLIPRGGAGLIRACIQQATVPCIQTGTGICHIYVDAEADLEMALDILENAKTSRPSVCNAAEVCLVHRDIAAAFLPRMKQRLEDERAARGLTPVELRLCGEAAALIPGKAAGPEDFDTEFLDYILAVKVVSSLEEALEHIAAHSTGHSEAIVTQNEAAAAAFAAGVDSAAVYINASTRFTDGGEFGLGCEMGISTQKLHARGPMGLAELTSYKYILRGTGQTR